MTKWIGAALGAAVMTCALAGGTGWALAAPLSYSVQLSNGTYDLGLNLSFTYDESSQKNTTVDYYFTHVIGQETYPCSIGLCSNRINEIIEYHDENANLSIKQIGSSYLDVFDQYGQVVGKQLFPKYDIRIFDRNFKYSSYSTGSTTPISYNYSGVYISFLASPDTLYGAAAGSNQATYDIDNLVGFGDFDGTVSPFNQLVGVTPFPGLSPVPLPSTALMFGAALFGLAGATAWRHRRAPVH